MIARIVFFVCFLIIVGSGVHNLCPSGQFFKDGKCQKCDSCYDLWRDKINPDKNKTLDLRRLEKDVDKLRDKLKNNAAKLSILKKSKTELLSYLKYIQLIGNNSRVDVDRMEETNFKYTEKLNVYNENIRYLEDDRFKLEKELESKPAADNSGYVQQIDQVENDQSKTFALQILTINAIKNVENTTNILREFNETSLTNRVNDEQQKFSTVLKQYNDSIARMNAEIRCENKLCSRNSTCRVCDIFTICYENDMLKFTEDVLTLKLDNLKKQTGRTKSHIPSLNNEANQIENQNKLVKDVLKNIGTGTEKNIVLRIKTFLNNFTAHNLDVYESISKLKISAADADIKNLASNFSAVITELSKILPDDAILLINRSKRLLESSIVVKEKIQFISETIKSVKNTLRGEKDVTAEEENNFKSYLLELAEILDENERRYNKLLNKTSRVEDKLKILEQLNARANSIFDDMWNAWNESNRNAKTIYSKVDNELQEILKKEHISRELNKRNQTLSQFWNRIEYLAARSADLAEKIRIIEFDYDQYLNMEKLQMEIETSLVEVRDVIEIVQNKSIVYEKCT